MPYQTLVPEGAYSLLENQRQAFVEGKLPKIADAVIKSVPIEESGEKIVDIRTLPTPRIAMMPDPKTPSGPPDCNAGSPESSMVRGTVYKKLEAMVDELDKLAPTFGFQKGQVAIRVYEGLRSLETQREVFDDKVREIQAAHPEFTHETCIEEASKWVSPVKNNVPAHSTGAAIDIRLYDLHTNTYIDMGKFGVIWGENPHAPTFSEGLTPEQRHHRTFLLMAAASVGLVNYPFEWWHFSTGDRYAAYWLKHQKAVYGSVVLPSKL